LPQPKHVVDSLATVAGYTFIQHQVLGVYTRCIVVAMSLPFALLGLLEDHPRHGYELKHLYDERFGASESLKFGQVYSTLGRLLRDGRINIAAVEAGQGPERKLYVITPEGVGDLERWLAGPQSPSTFARNALFSKVVVALMTGRPADEVLDVQRRAHLARMRELTERRRAGDVIEAMACDFELFHLEADLRWIEQSGAKTDQLRSAFQKEV
jgi:DNA-binding PadR family transcriptional regulator